MGYTLDPVTRISTMRLPPRGMLCSTGREVKIKLAGTQMNRPRRCVSVAQRTDAAQSDERLQAMRARGRVACDSTALALVSHSNGGDAEMERAAREDAPEEIDTEEDDAEFEERAHWGRRRAKTSGAKSTKKKAIEDDKRQPKIKFFCVVQPESSDKPEISHGTAKPPDPSQSNSAGTPCASSVEKVRVLEKEEDGNGGSSIVEVVMQATTSLSEVSPSHMDLAPSPVKANPTESTPEDRIASLLSPTMLSGRPKRQAVLKAAQAQLYSSDDSVFMTPPAVQPTTSNSAKKATLDGEPAKKAIADGKGAVVPSSGRKRKLEMVGEKKKPAQQTLKTPTKRPSTFFLTEDQKKQVIEIEAIETFKEQLREQRERDRAFFGNRDEVKNPFFQARQPTSSSQRVIDVDAPEVIEVLDSPEPSPAKQRKSKWSTELTPFPALQHIQCHVVNVDNDENSEMLPHPRKKHQSAENAIVIGDVDCDQDMDCLTSMSTLSPDDCEVQLAFSDMFWILSSSRNSDGEDMVLLSLQGKLSSDEFVEKLAESHGIKEKRIRKTLMALESARTKRHEKAHNLSLVDKYLPVQAAGMIGNKATLKKLTAWLSAWKNGGGSDRDRSYDDSLFAFEGDDSEDDEEGTQLYRLFIVEGDVGAGKSAAVYACAEELGYEIIEINAGQLRSGKAVLDIAGEATQSTRVLHGGGPVNDKKSKKKKKSKKRRTDAESSKPSHLSLVLFEDVDLIFDEDKGFLSTLGSIARHSKCPIVVTCRHLPENFPSTPAISERIMRPSSREFIAWMSLVAYLEGIALSNALVSRLAELFECDIRRTLQFLQTYRHQIDRSACGEDSTLVWKPIQRISSTAVGTVVNAPISIADSQDEDLPLRRVPAWSHSTLRPFDLLDSNFLPSLRGLLCERSPEIDQSDCKTHDEKVRHAECIDDMWSVLDAISLADEWECGVTTAHRLNTENGNEGADFFHANSVTRLTLDLRMLSLSRFVAKREVAGDLLSIQDCSVAEGVDRALQAAREDVRRQKKAQRLAALKTKLDLPSIVKGSESVGSRFCMDYLPHMTRIVENCEPFQESRRRASRRNHYLGDVLLDTSALDDIRDVQACFPPLSLGDTDEIVPLSASSPSTIAADPTSISI